LGVRQTKRAVELLQSINLLAVMRGRTNRYAIDWSEVEKRNARKCHYGTSGAATSAIHGTSTSAIHGTSTSAIHGTLKEKLKEEKIKPPPPASGDAWAAAAERFRGTLGQIHGLIRAAQERGATPTQFIALADDALATVELPPNRAKLQSPIGAAVYFLRNGFWPIDGIVSLEEHAANAARKAAEEAAAAAAEKKAAEMRAQSARDLEAAEERFGAYLDSLDELQRLELLQQTPHAFMAAKWAREPFAPNSNARLAALTYLVAHSEVPS
jgi:hypothetical protein